MSISRRALAGLVGLMALIGSTAGATAAQGGYPGENGRIFFHSCGDPCANFDIYSVNPDGSDLKNLTEALTTPGGTPESAFDPSVSADGKRVAFGVDTQATSEIWVMNADGSDPQQLTHDNLLDQEPSISPDGQRIVWNQWSPFPGYTDRDIWAMGSDGSGQQLLFNGFGTDLYPEFTPDGLTIVMAAETGDMDIRSTPSTPAMPPATTATGIAEDDALLESEPTVSPDGARVAFTQRPVAGPVSFDIYSVGIGGGTTTPVFATAASETSPAYSPDGTKIAFDSDAVPMIGNADGSGLPVPLNVGTLGAVSRFDWASKQASSGGGGGGGGSEVRPIPVPPDTRIVHHPGKRTKSHRAKFAFSSDQPAATFECKLDKKPFKPCASPFKKTVGGGRHTFRVRAAVAKAEADATPAKFSWRVLRKSPPRRHR